MSDIAKDFEVLRGWLREWRPMRVLLDQHDQSDADVRLDRIKARMEELELERDNAGFGTWRSQQDRIDELEAENTLLSKAMGQKNVRLDQLQAALREGRCPQCGVWFRDTADGRRALTPTPAEVPAGFPVITQADTDNMFDAPPGGPTHGRLRGGAW